MNTYSQYLCLVLAICCVTPIYSEPPFVGRCAVRSTYFNTPEECINTLRRVFESAKFSESETTTYVLRFGVNDLEMKELIKNEILDMGWEYHPSLAYSSERLDVFAKSVAENAWNGFKNGVKLAAVQVVFAAGCQVIQKGPVGVLDLGWLVAEQVLTKTAAATIVKGAVAASAGWLLIGIANGVALAYRIEADIVVYEFQFHNTK